MKSECRPRDSKDCRANDRGERERRGGGGIHRWPWIADRRSTLVPPRRVRPSVRLLLRRRRRCSPSVIHQRSLAPAPVRPLDARCSGAALDWKTLPGSACHPSLSLPPSLSLRFRREGRRPTRAFDSSEFRLRAGFIVVVFVFVSPSVSERGLARSRLGSETLPSLGRFSLSFASEYSES